VERPESETDHSPPPSVDVKKAWSYTSTPSSTRTTSRSHHRRFQTSRHSALGGAVQWNAIINRKRLKLLWESSRGLLGSDVARHQRFEAPCCLYPLLYSLPYIQVHFLSPLTSPWRWRHQGPPKRRYPTQKTATWVFVAVKTSRLAHERDSTDKM